MGQNGAAATPADRAAQGRAARKNASRSSHAGWIPAADRPDPVAVLERQGRDRLPELLPIRYGRMTTSPFAFLRGAAAVMAADLAAQPHTGLTVQLCGDAHLLNFGLHASPERTLLFDLNDFDETFPGPFEWDVKRLAASVAVAARENGHKEAQAHDAARAAAGAYREAVRRLAGRGELAVWNERIDAEQLLPLVRSARRRARVESNLTRARRRTSLHALERLTETVDGRRRIIHDPPLLEPAGVTDMASLRKIFSDYRSTLSEERRLLLDRYRFVDAARKVVGVGSVGTRCFIVLLAGRDADDPLFLQIKEAGKSVLEEHLPSGPYVHPGHRVVAGQRLLQAASDIFLGWMTGPQGRAFYWRQLRDMKGSADVAGMNPRDLRTYARLCGNALARAHARSGDRVAIAGYLGGADTFERAVADFALRYADQNAADHAALGAAVAAGVISAAPGV
ncbi:MULTISPECIES: DUF2252 domain-containing protein [unclassified Streptomyces]|uniref:DUF2252 domain-containing protein n=1 Tax=unclassified Streptomyces TaxID=2593676 RepID=UPI002E801F51|nr:DUF2252 domain-containing protein [Streptomyces sp. NBC_00589]WTI39785.1 DUF2252 domain-containing protein [Streptomyces sp. NBC_00775]WUB26535.1 DUF2252 domain-containing protein [Streptomyces sp. NBC_00589]